MTEIETVSPSQGETVFEVTVSQLVSCRVQVPARDAEDAHRRVTAPGFPLPPRQEWTTADDLHVEVMIREDTPVQVAIGDDRHADEDGCAIYINGWYTVLRLDAEDPSGLRRVRIQDLRPGDQFVESRHGMTVWPCVGICQTPDGWHLDLGDTVGQRPTFVPPDCTCTGDGEVKPDLVQCGGCGRIWCDRCTPTPSARCPYEYESDH